VFDLFVLLGRQRAVVEVVGRVVDDLLRRGRRAVGVVGTVGSGVRVVR
jgi:hypothetical protein